MSGLAFVDTHVHLWDLSHPRLRWSWVEPGEIHPILGDIHEIQVPLYGAEEFLAETRSANVSKVVHVQAAIDSADPVDETVWLQEAAERTGVPSGIVAHITLKADDVEHQIERHRSASGAFRGVRDFSDGDYLVDPNFARGYALLGRHGLVCDLDCVAENMAKARRLADAHPETTMILDHAGFPRSRTHEYFEFWRREMATLAGAESACCKISGLGMFDNQWTVDSIRPWFETCLETFGVERCVLGTNWPIDRLYSPYDVVVDAYAEIVAGLSQDEQVALFSANAERLYRL